MTPAPAGARPTERIPLNTLAIGFGLIGLADLWGLAAQDLGLPVPVSLAFWAVAFAALVWLPVAHLARGRRATERLIDQIRQPAQRPIAALVPIGAMLAGVEVARFSRAVGLAVVMVGLVATALFAASTVVTWITGRLALESVHGGYILPLVTGALVAAEATAELGFETVAVGAFVAGMVFWIGMLALLLVRLALRPPLPDALVPTLAIMLAPPCVATTAWFAITGGGVDPVGIALAAAAVAMLVVQAALLPRYLRLPFTLGFWSFTFPAAAAGSAAVDWLRLERPVGWEAVGWLVVGVATALVAAVAVASVAQVRRRGLPAAEQTLTDADARIDPARIDPAHVDPAPIDPERPVPEGEHA